MNVATKLQVTSGAIESLKWIALLCMVVDHANAVLYDRELGVAADIIGRVAMPLFAAVFGYNLARPSANVDKAIGKLVIFGILATPVHAAIFGMIGVWPLNILFTFAVAAWVIRELKEDRLGAALAAFILGGALVEYWWPGVGLVVAVWMMARSKRPADLLPVVGICLAAMCLLSNGNSYALLAVPVALLVVQVQPAITRLPSFFWWFYPLHLGAFWLMINA